MDKNTLSPMKNTKRAFSLVEMIIALGLGGLLFFALFTFFNRQQENQSATLKNLASLDNVVLPMRSLKADLKRARKILRHPTRDAIELSIGIYDSVVGVTQKTIFYEIVSGPCGSEFKGLTCKTLVRSEVIIDDPKPLKFPNLANMEWCIYNYKLASPFYTCSNLEFNNPRLVDPNAPIPSDDKRLGIRFSTFTGEKNPVSGLKDQMVVALETTVDLENIDYDGGTKILRFIK